SGILISLIPFESTYQAGLWIYVIGLTLFALLVLLKPSAQTGLQKYLLIALGILIANHLIKLFHYPLAGMAGFACIISLAFIVFCIVTRFKSVREESGALIIIATDAFIQFSQSADWIWDKA
ncbi:MAG TPA: hypothetical protein PKM16_05855, partial [Bacteroidia bacterium]|nr:hypothetical protein [Bacteroidia bacterium]